MGSQGKINPLESYQGELTSALSPWSDNLRIWLQWRPISRRICVPLQQGTYEAIMPKVTRHPSIMIKAPRLAAGEHSAWYDGTVEVWHNLFP